MKSRPFLIYVAAMSSGAATLIYELGWIRALALPVGAMFPAITLVMSTIMLGLGLGSLLGGRLAESPRHPLRLYALVELLVALSGLVFPVVLHLIGTLDVGDLGDLSGRAFLAGLLLLPLTTLMGTTFPLLSAALHRADQDAAHLPTLYSANTGGAALGTVLGGLVLPFVVGLPLTLALAGLLNLAAGALALLAARAPLPRLAVAEPAEPRPLGPGLRLMLLATAAGSGVLVMLAQLFWARSFLLLERRHYADFILEPGDAVSLILALILAGNGLGALIASRLNDAEPRRIATAVGLSFLAIAALLPWSWEWVAVRLTPPQGGALALLVRLALLVGPSILLGASFPLLARLYAGALRGHGRRLGSIWWVNSAAAVLGSAYGGFVLMPALGADNGLLLCAGLAFALASASLLWARRRLSTVLPLSLVGVGLLTATVLIPRGAGQQELRNFGPGSVLARFEGWEATSLVVQTRTDRGLVSNGRMIQARPGLIAGGMGVGGLMPKPVDSVMLVGFGTGLFAQGLLEGSQARQLVIVEIDSTQFNTAPWFGVDDLLTDPRVVPVVDDALHYLAVTDQTFDLIAVDAWGPEASSAVYTQEFHERALARSRPNGGLWAKLNALDKDSLTAVVDAVRCTWPYAALLGNPAQPEAVLGSKLPFTASGGILPLPPGEPCEPLRHLHPRRMRTPTLAPSASQVPTAR